MSGDEQRGEARWTIVNPPARPPMSQQWEGFEFAMGRAFAGKSTPLLMEPGTGKTKTIMMVGGEMWLRGMIDAVVIMAPNGVHRQWILEEAAKDMPLNVPWRGFPWKRAGSAVRHKRMAALAVPNKDSLLLVSFNFESVITDSGVSTIEWMLRKHRCLLVVDESSRIRNYKAERTKLALKLAPLAAHRAILTGTPNPKGYENLWSQLQFVDPSILNCPTFTAFKHGYCILAPIPGVRFGTRIVGYQRTEELLSKIKPHVFTKRKADCLNLPGELPPITRRLPMEPAQRKAYMAMREQHIVELERVPPGEPTAVMVQRVIAARSKLRQLAIGFLIENTEGNGTPDIVHWISYARLKRIRESIEDADDKVIVWSPYNAPKYEMAKLLGKADVSYMLDEDPGAQTEFNNNDTRVLLANPQRSGIGYNMANATRHIWIGPVDDEELRIQGRDRSYRIGQTKALTTENYAAPGTLEGGILARGVEKGLMLQLVLRRDWRALLSEGSEDSEQDDDTFERINARADAITIDEAVVAMKAAGADPVRLDACVHANDMKALRAGVMHYLPGRYLSDA